MKVRWPLVWWDRPPYHKDPQVIGSLKRPVELVKQIFLYAFGWKEKKFRKLEEKYARH